MTDGVSMLGEKMKKRRNWVNAVAVLLILVVFYEYKVAPYTRIMRAPVSDVINGMPGEEIKAASRMMVELGLIKIWREGRPMPMIYDGRSVVLGSYTVMAMLENRQSITCHSGLTQEIDVGTTSFFIVPAESGIKIGQPLFSNGDLEEIRPDRLRNAILLDIAACIQALPATQHR